MFDGPPALPRPPLPVPPTRLRKWVRRRAPVGRRDNIVINWNGVLRIYVEEQKKKKMNCYREIFLSDTLY